ncbi:hypothetical protein C0585_06860 [Candidatus Woesearchaeota archaeon]|nr:MAG: hypothetical protein C0585_06860 [Candidatus Woesearchaeota archaeon]
MAKIYDKCKLCGATKFLNYTRMCRDCNRSSAGVKIKEEALKKKFEAGKTRAKQAAKEAEKEVAKEETQTENAEEGAEQAEEALEETKE